MGLLNAIRRYGLPDEGLRAMPCTVFAVRSWMSCALSMATAPAATEISSDERPDSRNRKKLGHEPEWQELAEEGISQKIISNISNWKGRKRSPAWTTAERRRARHSACWPGTGRSVVTQQMLQHALSQLSEKEQLISPCITSMR